MGPLSPDEPQTHADINRAVKMGWVKQKKLPKKKVELAISLDLPEVAHYDYILAQSSSRSSNKKARTEELEEKTLADGDGRDELRADFFPQAEEKAADEAASKKPRRPRKAKATNAPDQA